MFLGRRNLSHRDAVARSGGDLIAVGDGGNPLGAKVDKVGGVTALNQLSSS
jgi:hypothetical protein